MRVLVTGASGRFAPYLVKALQGEHEIVLFSRREPSYRAGLPWIQGDLNSLDDCRRAVAGVDAIQHLGAVPFPSDHPAMLQSEQAKSPGFPSLDATMRTNILGTYNLLQAAVAAGVQTVVMTGSNCAFGHGYRISNRPFPIHYLPLDEKHPSDVEDSYSTSKLMGEELLASFSRAYGIRTYVTRPSGIRPPEALARMAETAKPARAWDPWMWGYIASEDLARLHKMLMEKADTLPVHDVYIANALDTTAVQPTAELVARFRPELAPLAAHMTGHEAFFSSAKAKEAVGWVPVCGWRR